VLNITASIGIVFLNKWLFVNLKFPFSMWQYGTSINKHYADQSVVCAGTTVTFLHFVTTALGLQLCVWYGAYHLSASLPLCLSASLYVRVCIDETQRNAFDRARLFKPKPLPTMAIASLSFGFCGFVVLANLSLLLNSVGFYQVRSNRCNAMQCNAMQHNTILVTEALMQCHHQSMT
jgi:hypothetical protein